MDILLDLRDLFKIIVPLSIIIGTIIKTGSKFFYQTEIDRMLSTKQSRINEEMVGSLGIALLFSVITGFGIFTDLPFFQDNMIQLPFWNEFNLAFIYFILFIIGCFLFYLLLFAGAFPFIRKMALYKKQIMMLIAKITYLLTFPTALLLAFSIKLNFDDFSINNILLAFAILTVFYTFILTYLTYLKQILSNEKLKYYIQTIYQPEANERLKKLYFVYALDKERFILSDKQHVNASNLSTPIYIYNHVSNTLTFIDEVNNKNSDEKSRLQTHAHNSLFHQ